ncbi:hypothetical protein RB25_09725 [Herbaspirillum rubrisubalbicans]|uniref:WbqC family protein n=1 Tax=Herbaspirillum rubrisubalbicans TaxID=80842 RepID=A0ABX9BZX6_9BURK|nr:WbqC family protein [Herbaspirillum rubrisubalbicans]RAM63599.1 hypothetical protein RB24_16110 [Herbaspirillum rubrisubalbicans]RAN48611.1 hypothetical protein RB25_09725 [Herbaspirillum rubrisubalbicans]
MTYPRTVVVSQPMFFPWLGLFEQIRLADVFVHYDDVQLPQGRSLMSRVQIKTNKGTQWMSASLDRQRSGQAINQSWLVSNRQWRQSHLHLLQQHYRNAPHFDDMFALAQELYGFDAENLADFNINGVERIAAWLDLSPQFSRSSQLGIPGASSQRLLDLCKHYQASDYVTGLGALNYIDYALFEAQSIAIRFMDYRKMAYPQLHGVFTPYVSVFDAIANCGTATKALLCSDSIYWKDYTNEPG